jgi:hypothetical protein
MYVTLALVVALLGPARPAAAEGVAIRLEFPAKITLGEPLVADFVVENTMPVPVTLMLGTRGTQNMKVAVTGPDGRRRAGTFLMKEGISGDIGLMRVEPNATARKPIFLLEWFTSYQGEIADVFARPGAYAFDLELTQPIQTASGFVGPPPSTRLYFEILPRNEATLRATAEKLAATVIAQNYQGAETAKILAEIRDVQAVPSIRQVLQHTNRYDWILLRPLAEIRDQTARALLENYSRSGDDDRRAMARDGLNRRVRSGIDQ